MIHKHLITLFTSTLYAGKQIAGMIGKRCHYGMIPRNQVNVFPRVYLMRTSIDNQGDIDGNKGGFIEENFDCELISNATSDIDSLSDKLWSDVHLHYGLISSTQLVKGIFVENQSDDYEPKGIGDDIGLDVASFNLRIVHGS